MSRETELHNAVCNAVVCLNKGETSQASHILRTALVEYADYSEPQAAQVPEGYK